MGNIKYILLLVENAWPCYDQWQENSPLRIELFSLEMQAVYGSYYRNKVTGSDLIKSLI